MTDDRDQRLRMAAKEATPGPWFMHDFSYGSINPRPTARDVTVSCDHPATITVAEMRGGLWSNGENSLHWPQTVRQAKADATYIALANPQAVIELLDRVTVADKERERLAAFSLGFRAGQKDMRDRANETMNSSLGSIKLALGEMTAQEIRNVHALMKWCREKILALEIRKHKQE